jgi:hypothetical protein
MITFTHPTTREIIMRRLSTIVGGLLIAATPALANKAEPVIIDAADGGTEVEVQAALDANPENTSFLLLGNFAFSAAVHIEKSGTRIIGDWVDTNGDGKPDPGDDWNTVINAIPNMYGFSEAFILMPTDELGSEGYDVEDVEVSGLHISGFNWTLSQHFFASWDQPGCRTEALPYRLSGMRAANNWIEGGGMYINRRVEEATIDNNLFTLFEGNEMFRHAVEMRGLEWSECGMPFSLDDPGQEGLTITNNVLHPKRPADQRQHHDRHDGLRQQQDLDQPGQRCGDCRQPVRGRAHGQRHQLLVPDQCTGGARHHE